MHKIIHSDFQLDLSSYTITNVEENHWFSDQFFSKYSFPFDMYITEELMAVFGDLLDDNNNLRVTYFEVQYVFQNKIEAAILEIENQQGKLLKPTIRYGLDELPNWDKKLNELPLEQLTVADITTHAKTIIPQTWPAVNYNFPQIHTDKYDTTEDTWLKFKKIINNYDGTDFLINTFTSEDFANRNIIQPLPSLLHVLTILFSDAGFTLKGSVTTDEVFKKMLLFTDLDYYNEIDESVQEVLVDTPYSTDPDGGNYYLKGITLQKNSKYRITGLAAFYNYYTATEYRPFARIAYRGENLFYKRTTSSSSFSSYSYYDIDVTFETLDDDLGHTLAFSGRSFFQWDNTRFLFGSVDGGVKIEKIVSGLDAVPSEMHFYNDIDLRKVVPEITGGTLITILKNWFNIDLDIDGNDIYMDFIEDEINYNNAENLEDYTELTPLKTSNNSTSFLLKFEDIDNEDFTPLSIFHSKNGVELSDKNVLETTNTIEVSALPLPQKSVSGINTAYAIDNGGSTKVYAVLYNGLNEAGLNLTEDSTPITIPEVHSRLYFNWFEFRINSVTYKWSFKMFAENLSKIKKKIFAYGRYHIIKTIEKTQVSEDLFEVDIETDTLK